MTDLIGDGGEQVSADSIRAKISSDRQREIDARFASYFSTSSELAAFAPEDVRTLYKGAR